MCPGTVAGQFVSDIHEFCNLSYAQNRDTMTSIINIITHYKPQAKFLLTVSPIPLVATASDDHVLVATEYSKSTLRAMAGDIANSMRGVVEYFPSYEIITSHPYRGVFFDQNMRTVSPYGVGFVMKHFFSALSVHSRGAKIDKRPHVDGSIKDKLVGGFEGTDSECEQLVLDGFSGMSP